MSVEVSEPDVSDFDVVRPSVRDLTNTTKVAPNDGVHEWLDRGRIPVLDGLRALAVMAVILTHAVLTRGFPDVPLVKWMGSKGPLGVEIFFVISGFLITTLLARELDRTGRIDLKGFYWRRTLRIVPAYCALLIVVAVAASMGIWSVQSRDWIAALTYTVNFIHRPAWEIGHAWSLSIEEHFYLLWPVTLLLMSRRCASLTAILAITVGFLVRWIVLLKFPAYSAMSELWTFTRLDGIACGCLLALAIRNPVVRNWWNRWFGSFEAMGVASIVLICSLLMSSSAKFSVGIGYTLNAFCLTVLIWGCVIRKTSLLGRFLEHPWMVAIGVRSYSLYLWQQLFLNHHRSGFLYEYPQNILFAVLAAWFSYRYIEQPFLALKKSSSR